MQALLPGCLLAAACLAALPAPAMAQGWAPQRPVAFIAGSAAGGSIDLTARTLQRVWEQNQTVKPPVIVVNKPGAGNSAAWNYLNERGADGHAIAIGTTNLVSNPVVDPKLAGYRDVTPLALLFDDYFLLMVRADSPLKTLADVRQRLQQDPAALSIGYGPGVGAGSHSAAAVAVKGMGVDVRKSRMIPYRSAGDAISAMLGGQIDIVSGTAANAPPFIAAGRVRAIAVIAPQRLGGVLAQVPTAKEQGVDASFTNWRGVIGPKGMRREQVEFWVGALRTASASEAWQRDLERNFWKANFISGEAFDRFLRAEVDRFRAIWADIGDAR
jgi:putative tricarboxylic transport membrane protein